MYIYISIYPLIYTPLPNSRWLYHTALRYGRRVQLGAYMWRKGLDWVKAGSNRAKKHLFEHPKWSGITFGKTCF